MKSPLTSEFWLDILTKLGNWCITELPSILILVVIFVIALKFFDKLSQRLRPFLDSICDAILIQSRN